MKTALIIGASSGIGKGVAELLTEKGFKVIITGRRKELLKKIKAERPESYIVKSFDISNIEETTIALEEIFQEVGKLDLVLLSSGTGYINRKLYFNIEKETIDINVTGFTYIADTIFHFFTKQGFGHFAAITSVAGIRGEASAPAYNATKAYQMNYLESLRKKAFKSGKKIYITDIRPGFVNTDMAKGEGVFWSASVKKASEQIYKTLKSKKKIAYITKRWFFIALILKFLPKFIYDRF